MRPSALLRPLAVRGGGLARGLRLPRLPGRAVAQAAFPEARPRRFLLASLGLALGTAAWLLQNEEAEAAEAPPRPDLPRYTSAEVAQHNGKGPDGSLWVSYAGGVYDVTQFAQEHPGGKARVLLAAGGPLEPFWALYGAHQTAHVLALLERHRIGSLLPDPNAPVQVAANDPYAHDPPRHPALVVRSPKPYNAETPQAVLSDYLTPNELFYVRNHLPVPDVDPASYALELVVPGQAPLRLSLAQLQALPAHTITATLQCAGNRRNEMSRAQPGVRGGAWETGALSNATWTGVRVRDVLQQLGVDAHTAQVRHVHFEGLDRDHEKAYGASIPLHMALDPTGDVLLAYAMNGQPLPRDHGFPLRVLVPGVAGARSVKWLGRIELSAEESPSHWQRNDYKLTPPSADWQTVQWGPLPAIQEMPVQSMITSPSPNEALRRDPDGTLELAGVAWAGGGRPIVRVDVSADGGKTWTEAKLEPELPPPGAQPQRAWAWRQWRAAVPAHVGATELVCRATDASANTQPERVESIWNLRGLLNNAWHRVKVTVADE